MFSCLPICDVRDLIFSQFSIDCCQKYVCFRGSAPDPAGGLTAPPKPPAGYSLVTNRSCPDQRPCFHIHLPLATPLVIVNCPALIVCNLMESHSQCAHTTDLFFDTAPDSYVIRQTLKCRYRTVLSNSIFS